LIILASKSIVPVSSARLFNGAIAINGTRIAEVGTKSSLRKRYPEARVIDLGDVTLMPGLVNTHAHLELSYLSGLYNEERDFFRWIQRLIDKRRRLGFKGLKSSAVSALRQAVSTGTTSIGDVSGTGALANAIKSSGIRAVIFHEIIGMDPKGAKPAIENLFKRFDKLDKMPSRIRLGVSPHSPYSVSDALFRLLAGKVSESTLHMCVHVSESSHEYEHMRGRPSDIKNYLDYTGWSKHKTNRSSSSVSLLEGYGLLKGMLAVHGVHLNRADINRLKRNNASVSHCPRSNHLLNVGKAPIRNLMDAGVNVSLGTDSLASNLDLDMWEEMRFSYLVNDITAEEALRMSTVNGAKALGIDDVTGSLEPGREADIIAVESPATTSRDPYPDLVCHTYGRDVVMSMVQGRVIYSRDGIDI